MFLDNGRQLQSNWQRAGCRGLVTCSNRLGSRSCSVLSFRTEVGSFISPIAPLIDLTMFSVSQGRVGVPMSAHVEPTEDQLTSIFHFKGKQFPQNQTAQEISDLVKLLAHHCSQMEVRVHYNIGLAYYFIIHRRYVGMICRT